MRVLIGPKEKYGGVPNHIENIKSFSKKDITEFHSPNLLSVRLIKDFDHALKLAKIETIDPLGLFLSKIRFPGEYNIIHLHGHPWWPEVYGKTKGAKYIHTVHQIYKREDFRSERKWKTREWLNELLFKSCRNSDVVISVAQWQQPDLRREGIDSIYIPNGVNVEKCQVGNADRFRKKYDVEKDFFLFGGDLRWYKRPELFIRLAQRMPDNLFVMKGRDVTKEKIRNMGFDPPKNLICLGLIPYRDLLDAYAASRVLVLTSKNDTFPTVLLEAMSLKKVVVGANNAGPKEIVTDEKDGFLFEPDEIKDLHEKALKAWERPELGRNGYKKVKEKFDWRVIIKQIDKVYEELMVKNE